MVSLYSEFILWFYMVIEWDLMVNWWYFYGDLMVILWWFYGDFMVIFWWFYIKWFYGDFMVMLMPTRRKPY